MKPLSAKQKSVLCQIARRAFDHLLAAGKIAGVDFDPWRRDEVERATGRHGLRECGDPHYRPLAAHFESLAGEDGRALNHLLAANTDARRKMEVVLLRALEGAGLGLCDRRERLFRPFRCISPASVICVRNKARPVRLVRSLMCSSPASLT